MARTIRNLGNFAIVADIRGSKIRVGDMPQDGVLLLKGSKIIVDTTRSDYKSGVIPIPFRLSRTKIKKGSTIFLDDGTILLDVQKIAGPRIFCRVTREGRLFSRKGVNIPGASLYKSGISEQDKKDILFGKKLDADYISLSFLSSKKDVDDARSLLEGSSCKIIAKIETQESLRNMEEIVPAVDAVMIARGDLGLEIPLADVPLKQKEIMQLCRTHDVPVIVATQMLASMMNTLVPTRAEVSDVANAVFDSADVVMLSGETAAGLYPVDAVKTMREIIVAAEAKAPRNVFDIDAEGKVPVNIAVAEAACRTAEDVHAKFILVGTTTGFSARAVASYRPSAPIVATTDHRYVAQQLSLVWGVRTLHQPEVKGIENALSNAIERLKKEGALKRGDVLVYVSGIAFGKAGGTNMLRVIEV